jgi:hypothetical protein
VETVCHPDIDRIAAHMESGLLQAGQIQIKFDFPYASARWGKDPADWSSPDKHSSDIISRSEHSVAIKRTLDADQYFVTIRWDGIAEFTQIAKHSFLLLPSGKNQFEFSFRFSRVEIQDFGSSEQQTFEASRIHWRNFGETGGAVDLSLCKDSRAHELERRIVLSLYLTAVQCAGLLPPAETGLTFNSWYGKFHLEMHWWHGGKPG